MRCGSLDELRRFLNVDHQGWTLIKAFLVAALRPSVPYPILLAKGEQGVRRGLRELSRSAFKPKDERFR